MYVVGSAKMIPSIQRQPKALSARSWFARLVCVLVGCSKRSMHVFEANLGASSQGDSLLLRGVRITRRILSSKPGIDMNHAATGIISRRFEETKTESSDKTFDLMEWVKKEMVHIVSESTYGPENFMWKPEIADAFWYVPPPPLQH